MPELTVVVLIAAFVAALLLLRWYNRDHGPRPHPDADELDHPKAK
ncbi:hypothetical protein [Nocardia thraciensis]